MPRFVKQKGHNDCGIASLAMLLDTSYQDVLHRYHDLYEIRLVRGLSGVQVHALAQDLTGWKWELRQPANRRHLKTCDNLGIDGPYLLLIQRTRGEFGHWVMCQSGVVYDPAEHHGVSPKYALRANFRINLVLQLPQ